MFEAGVIMESPVSKSWRPVISRDLVEMSSTGLSRFDSSLVDSYFFPKIGRMT